MKKRLGQHLQLLKNGRLEGLKDYNITDKYNTIDFNIWLLNRGIYESAITGNQTKAFDFLNKSRNIAKIRKDNILLCESIKSILEIYESFHIPIDDISYRFFIDELEKFAYNDNLRILAKVYEFRIIQRYNYEDLPLMKKIYTNANSKVNSTSSPLINSKTYLTYFLYHQDFSNQLDSSEFYLNKAILELSSTNGFFENERKLALKINQASLEISKKNYNKAVEYLNLFKIRNQSFLYQSLNKFYYYKKYLAFQGLGNKEKTLENHNKYLIEELKSNRTNSQFYIAELETKNQTAKKEKQILEEQQRTRTNRNWLIAASLALILGTGISILLQKNTTKKRKLAEQEALLEQQKVETLLKEQELVSIDAMIAGQEKERTKVANELHDDLGSLMATVKLHFDNVKVDKKNPALKNAQDLLEKAYQKIRGMAHAKNSGVMTDQGLLPAIKKMAKTISLTNALEITVEDFGLGERMENSLELTIFRIIQELVTNIIKHSGATTSNIQFTQYEDNLNIIVADNGKGFDMSAVQRTKNGMGLGTIEKRIERLEGAFTVDSAIGKGTSIIIDIPI